MRLKALGLLLLAGCPPEPAPPQPRPVPTPAPTPTPSAAPSASVAGPTAADCEARVAASLKTIADPRDALAADNDCCAVLAKKHDGDAGASWDGDHRTYCCTLLNWSGARACTP